MKNAGWWLAVAFGLTAGCNTPAPKVEPAGMAAVVVQPSHKHTTVSTSLQHFVTVTLPPEQPAHHWEIALHDSRYLAQETTFLPPESSDSGPRISFLTLRPGRTRLRFVMVPNDAGRTVAPADLREVVVVIE